MKESVCGMFHFVWFETYKESYFVVEGFSPLDSLGVIVRTKRKPVFIFSVEGLSAIQYFAGEDIS